MGYNTMQSKASLFPEKLISVVWTSPRIGTSWCLAIYTVLSRFGALGGGGCTVLWWGDLCLREFFSAGIQHRLEDSITCGISSIGHNENQDG